METSRITMTGCTWTGELWTTLHGIVVGAGSLRSQRDGMPRPGARITRHMDLWERGLHAGLVEDAEAEGAA